MYAEKFLLSVISLGVSISQRWHFRYNYLVVLTQSVGSLVIVENTSVEFMCSVLVHALQVRNIYLWGLDTLGKFSAIFYMGDNFL